MLTPEDEQVSMTWALRQLHRHPVLDASWLTPEAGWGREEVVQIVPSELPTEDLMRIWDALSPSYRLSVSWVARLVRASPPAEHDAHFGRKVYRTIIPRNVRLAEAPAGSADSSSV